MLTTVLRAPPLDYQTLRRLYCGLPERFKLATAVALQSTSIACYSFINQGTSKNHFYSRNYVLAPYIAWTQKCI